eukprot:SAG22_NODE_5113_length_1083_cov_1.021341_1_plen_111_part_00
MEANLDSLMLALADGTALAGEYEDYALDLLEYLFEQQPEAEAEGGEGGEEYDGEERDGEGTADGRDDELDAGGGGGGGGAAAGQLLSVEAAAEQLMERTNAAEIGSLQVS